MRKLLLLRPEPGLSASAKRARALGLDVISCQLFQVEELVWDVPNPADYDALLLTSANAVRHAGQKLARLADLPAHVVGEATANAASDAGLKIEMVGSGNMEDLLAMIAPSMRLLHLTGEDHRHVEDARIDRRIVYRAGAISSPDLPSLHGLVVAVHSPRAGARLAGLSSDRASTMIAAISDAAAAACGLGWEEVAVADEPNDKSLLALAASLCHKSGR